VRWHYRDPLLLWLFVPAYLVHLAEEYWAGPGLPAWFARILGRELPEAAFVAINGAAFVLLIAAVRAAARREAAGWIAVAVATVVSLNAVLHLLGALATASYSPGMISGVVVYLPLGLLTLIRAGHQQAPPAFARGIAAGIAFHALVIAVAYASTR
jgi:hypothetical protein